ncbi:MAG: rhamnogalacturonan acetylesterase [Bacteroidaceae bacterium]|nr:rhamnogalacturonan acetylesterase [Bacteroidaceae bacterium]
MNLLISLAASLLIATAPIHKSYKVEDGNYRVTVTIGSKRQAGNTWVRAESRRLMLQEVKTKKNEFKTFTFVVHKRSPRIDDRQSVKLKDRERGYLNWDDSLTIDFCGPAPVLKDIKIERDTTATTLFLCGNSTVVDQEPEPWASWGQMIPRWWDEHISIANYAESGERTTSFIAENRWAKVMSMAKAGDYIFIEFGHNDEKDRGPGSGAWYNFSTNLKRFIDEARAKQCNVVLVTPTARRSFRDGHNQNTHGDYPAAVLAVSQREGIPMIDLTDMSTQLYDTFGEEGSKQLLVHYPANTFPDQPTALADNTHFNTFGAYELSKCIVMGIKQLGLPIAKYLRHDWTDFSPVMPDDPKLWNWPMVGVAEMTKPDGN